MNSPRQEIDMEFLTTHYKSIPFKGTYLELWDRTVQGKTIGIRIQSMLPQITISSRTIEILNASTRQKKVGICTAFKYSPTHYLSLTSSECIWTDTQSLPKADYLIYLKPTNLSKIIDHLSHEEKILENFQQSLEKLISRRQKVEILDLCRTVTMFTKDKISKKLLLRFEILFPYINLLFAPIAPIKLVSSSLTKRLIQPYLSDFENGFLTMDQSSRIVPLEFNDKMVMEYPIVGIWVKGIPQTNASSKSFCIVHPLVWAACVQYITFDGFKEKVSPSLPNCTFLFIDFSSKPKFYEASSQKQPAWKTSFFSVDLASNTDFFPSLQINFLKHDTRFTLKRAVSESLSYISQSTSNSRSNTPPSAKPPIHRTTTPTSSVKELKPLPYDSIILEQTKLIEKLQAQVHKLQTQFSPKSKSSAYLNFENERNAMVNIETNTTVSMLGTRAISGNKLKFEDDAMDEGADEKRMVYVSGRFHHPKVSQRLLPSINCKNKVESHNEEYIKNPQMKYMKK